ncbi:MAG: DEAD/DEAH box helicase [Caedimonadaceae bacterium]|nr:MAG: DEAD/DEAH box helicase [Caedimonadaceae bacterium]
MSTKVLSTSTIILLFLSSTPLQATHNNIPDALSDFLADVDNSNDFGDYASGPLLELDPIGSSYLPQNYDYFDDPGIFGPVNPYSDFNEDEDKIDFFDTSRHYSEYPQTTYSAQTAQIEESTNSGIPFSDTTTMSATFSSAPPVSSYCGPSIDHNYQSYVYQEAEDYTSPVISSITQQIPGTQNSLNPATSLAVALQTPSITSSPSPTSTPLPYTKKSKLESHLEEALLNRSKMSVQVITPEDRYRQLSASFPHELTADQINGIRDIENELASGRPMNHMVVGDVGFGKTELAIRASCLVSLKSKQVVIVSPRKVLAEQHYKDFEKRLSPLGIQVINFSSNTAKQKRLVEEQIKCTKPQVIVGTSSIFNATKEFRDVGLIIIDEEQLFGVKQKENLKAHFNDAHVLWMSATPIPRTFNLIKKGLMSISELKTPPAGRVNTETQHIESDDEVMKELAKKEFDRNGQIFYVTHKISPKIDEAYTKWTALFPEKRIAKLHGDMDSKTKQAIMDDFKDGNIDVLICTKIVSVGLNVPKANSIFIEEPSKFGTSELVQLRGRVGRSTIQAYAYLLNNTQSEKLQKFVETASVGGGVQLAKYDAEERGFGEILGEKQNDRKRTQAKAPSKYRRVNDLFHEID